VAQLNSYYGFGKGMPGSAVDYTSSPKNNYLYNGKELVDDLGWYDYGARMYDPVIGRFTTIDPHADRYVEHSPYNYVSNNPLMYIDPTGKDLVRIRIPDGNGWVKFATVDSKNCKTSI
jgi:RHS repeat-associated protein